MADNNRSPWRQGGYDSAYHDEHIDMGNDYNPGGYYRGDDRGSFGHTLGGNRPPGGRREEDSPAGHYGLHYESPNYRRDRGWWDRTRDEVSSWMGDREAGRRRRIDTLIGKYRGRGPKNYRRSEDRIREEVCERLSDDERIDASNIDVRIEGDEVVLNGTVDSREQKRRAEDLVEAVSGVHNVQNCLRVERRDR